MTPHAATSTALPARQDAVGPPNAVLAFSLLLTGVGTVVLGPLLPQLSHQLALTDAMAGRLLAAKFVGAFLGGITTRNTRWGIGFGALLSALGFAWLGMTASFAMAAIAVAVSGYGVGQMITAINILAGRRYTAHTGSALALLNTFWSTGALLCGAAVALWLPRLGLRGLMLSYAALFALALVAGELFRTSPAAAPVSADSSRQAPGHTALPVLVLTAFVLVLFCYGGLETCLSDWITTYAQRYGGARQLLDGQSAIILMWTAITVSRGAASGVLQRVSERRVALASIAGTAIFAACLLFTHSGAAISAVTLLIGAAMAAYFPTMFGSLMRWQPPARQASLVMSVSGLGAATFLWLTGTISSRSHSLRLGMTVPLGLACALLAITWWLPPSPSLQVSSQPKSV